MNCELIAQLGRRPETLSGIKSPIVGPDEAPCAYRISANFAMQELDDLIDPQNGKQLLDDDQIKNIREMLGQFYSSHEAAFDLELTATVNGRPIRFRELTGDKTGNESVSRLRERHASETMAL